MSSSTRETETPVFPFKPGEMLILQVPQTGSLDQQMLHTQREQTVTTKQFYSLGHDLSMCYMFMIRSKTAQQCLSFAHLHTYVGPAAHAPSRDLPHLGGTHYHHSFYLPHGIDGWPD